DLDDPAGAGGGADLLEADRHDHDAGARRDGGDPIGALEDVAPARAVDLLDDERRSVGDALLPHQERDLLAGRREPLAIDPTERAGPNHGDVHRAMDVAPNARGGVRATRG